MSLRGEHDTLPPSMDPAPEAATPPPIGFWATLRRLGPGLIIAGSIVGSGELIATTKTGAQAGISLLWLIVIGCLIKVFVQIELGRYTISAGETTLAALNRVPGPRAGVNWIVWFWLAMMAVGLGQLGGIVGGVGQSLALSFPIRGDYADAIRMPSIGELQRYLGRDDQLLSEWDLRLYAARDEPHETSGTETGPDPRPWIEHVVGTTEKHLAQLPTDEAQALLTITQDLLAAERTLDASPPGAERERRLSVRETARRRLDERLEHWNQQQLQRDAAEPPGSPAAEAVARAAEKRIVRGHAVLAQQLADLDRGSLRAARAMAAVAALGAAQAEYDSAQKQQRSTLDLQFLKARRDHCRQVADVLIEPATLDDKYWAAAATAVTIALLYVGRYGLIQGLATAMVVAFTFITIGNVMALQSTVQWHISPAAFRHGFSFQLPEGTHGLATALAAFGIIGVGASELISYPYWCLEKGYARFTGQRNASEQWAAGARGWIRVMQYDALLSMVIYTIATLAFFVMGVAVLYNEGRDPDGMRMVSTLSAAYVPVFGEHARWLFLIGAIAVLYSTFLVSNASHARTLTDVLKVFGLMSRDNQRAHDRSVTAISVGMPLVCLSLYCGGINPVKAVLLAGGMQALLLPMIGLGALYFRYTRTDERLRPGPAWDLLLIVSFLGLLVAGAYGSYTQVTALVGQLWGG